LARLWALRENAGALTPEALQPDRLPGLIPDSRAMILDGADRIAGHAEAERALFHLYNLIAEAAGRLLLVANRPVAGWGVVLPDLGSRLRTAPSVAIAAPDDAVLAAVLVKLLADRQLRPPPEVVAYLVPRMERSFAAASQLAAELDRAALAAKRPITLPLARRVLATLAAIGAASSSEGS
jgi:chromosomal replication initiation ATPase DnaA